MSKAAVIGCGRRVPGKVGFAQGHAHARSYTHAFPETRLYGVDPNEENLHAFGDAFQLAGGQLFRNTGELYRAVQPDIVSIVTWPGLHLQQVLEAVQAGVKFIVCEKPLALDNSEIDQMLEACEKAGARLAVAHQRRYDPRFELVKEIVGQGALGEKPVLTGRVTDGWDILSWTSHWFDMANYIFDGPPESILAGIDHSGERRYGHAVENAAVVFAEYSLSRQAIFISGPESCTGFSVSVDGTEGLLRMTETGVLLMTTSGIRNIEAATRTGDHYSRLFLDFARAGARGEDFRCDARHTAWATRMAFAVHESAISQRKVKLPSRTKFAPLEILQHPPMNPPGAGLKIVALTDRHHWDAEVQLSGRDGLVEALVELGHDVTQAPLDERELTPEDMAGKDLLVIYHTRRKSSEQTRNLVEKWIQAGKPTLVTHCGIGAWDWEDYRRWVGRYWVWADEDADRKSRHPVEPCEIEVDQQSTLWSAPWRKAWMPRDEVYTHLGESGPVEDIAWAVLNGERHPWAWRSKTVPALAVYLPGHRADIWRLEIVRSGLRSMIGLVASCCLSGAQRSRR